MPRLFTPVTFEVIFSPSMVRPRPSKVPVKRELTLPSGVKEPTELMSWLSAYRPARLVPMLARLVALCTHIYAVNCSGTAPLVTTPVEKLVGTA